MSLLEEAARTVRSVLRDTSSFGVPITVTSPEGVSHELRGIQTDVGLSVDPETGTNVALRRAAISLSLPDLQAANFQIPENIPEEESRPWLVTWTPPTGEAQTMKVIQATPDKLGIVVLHVSEYRS